MAVWVWLLVAGGLFVVETLTANLLFASLAISAATAMLTAWVGGGFLAQGVAFAVSAILTLAVLRPVALREISSNYEGLASSFRVLERSDFGSSEIDAFRRGIARFDSADTDSMAKLRITCRNLVER
jgi:hypothetical protein